MHYNDEHFIINLNRNKLTYIFPLMNYITRHKLTEISEKEMRNIKFDNMRQEGKELVNNLGILATGIGISFGFILKQLLDYLNFNSNLLVKVIILIISIVTIFILKEFLDRKNKKKINFKSNKAVTKAIVLPRVTVIIKCVLINILLYFLLTAFITSLIRVDESNFIVIPSIMLIFIFLLFQNKFLYKKTEIDGKISNIKLKK